MDSNCLLDSCWYEASGELVDDLVAPASLYGQQLFAGQASGELVDDLLAPASLDGRQLFAGHAVGEMED